MNFLLYFFIFLCCFSFSLTAFFIAKPTTWSLERKFIWLVRANWEAKTPFPTWLALRLSHDVTMTLDLQLSIQRLRRRSKNKVKQNSPSFPLTTFYSAIKADLELPTAVNDSFSSDLLSRWVEEASGIPGAGNPSFWRGCYWCCRPFLSLSLYWVSSPSPILVIPRNYTDLAATVGCLE